MMNIISFSGGKDSTALVLWAIEKLKNFQVVFCDTGWEHPITYDYIEYINQTLLEEKLIILKSKKYDGFEDLCVKKQRAPSVMARFCTQELKIFPLRDYFKTLKSQINMFNGIRAEESIRRSKMSPSYYDNLLGCRIYRPLLRWSTRDVFDIHQKHRIKPNPLYKMGMGRVGCMPCIMVNHSEMKIIIKSFPEIINKVKNIEVKTGRSFFGTNYIPDWACSGKDEKSGKKFPWIDDVVKYLSENENQMEIFEMPRCMSFYGLCE